MPSLLHVQGRTGPRTLLPTTAAVPLSGSAVHSVTLHRQLVTTRTDPLTGLLRRDSYTARARRLWVRRGDDVAASVGTATPPTVGSRDLTVLQRAADTARYDGKHSGRAAVASPAHTTVPAIKGRRAGRPGTAVWGRAA